MNEEEFEKMIMETNQRVVVEDMFTYHPPKPGQPEKYGALRSKAKELAYLINDLCPVSSEKVRAREKLQEVIFLANAAIALHEKPKGENNE